jgi:transposase-like protein
MTRFSVDPKSLACVNPECEKFSLTGLGNISLRCHYGKDRRPLYYCRSRGKTFSATRGTPYFSSSLKPETIDLVCQCATEGVGVRATSRLVHVDKNTVCNIIRRAGQSSAAVMDKECTSLTPTQVQFDELWSFAQKKRRRNV